MSETVEEILASRDDEIANLSDMIADLRDDNKRLRREIEDLERDGDRLEGKLSERDDRINELEAELEGKFDLTPEATDALREARWALLMLKAHSASGDYFRPGETGAEALRQIEDVLREARELA